MLRKLRQSVALVFALALLSTSARCEWHILTFEAVANFDRLGTTVAAPGDVNGDGWPDLFVGAGVNDDAAADAGQAYLYFGGPDADNAPDLVLTGEAYQDRFAFWVDGAGDVNGDGYPDLLIGAPYQDTRGSDSGAAYLFLGGPDADDQWDLKVSGEAPDDQFASTVSSAGDVNHDGYCDWMAGAFLHDEPMLEAGRVYLYFGGPVLDGEADMIFEGQSALDRFGFSLADLGDVNGDGCDDIAIGAYQADLGGNDSGAVYVFFGGEDMDTVADMVLSGVDIYDEFGSAVCSAGDMNGDGHTDFAVGAKQGDAGADLAGSVSVYLGGPDIDDTPDLVVGGEIAFDHFGAAIAGVGDTDGDGFDDLLIGARDADANGLQSGSAYLLRGGSQLDGTFDLILIGESDNDRFGYAVAGPGDIDGDGHCDLLIGARMADAVHFDAGRAYVIAAAPYHVDTPDGGETWIAGETVVVSWHGRRPVDVDLSLDGGWTWQLIAVGVGGDDVNELPMIVPDIPTDMALLRVRATGDDPLTPLRDQGDGVFRIASPDIDDGFAVWPSPSRDGAVSISFRAAGWLGSADSDVNLAVYGLDGRLHRTIVAGDVGPGAHTTAWDGRDHDGRPVASGVYVVRLSTAGLTREQRLTVIR